MVDSIEQLKIKEKLCIFSRKFFHEGLNIEQITNLKLVIKCMSKST